MCCGGAASTPWWKEGSCWKGGAGTRRPEPQLQPPGQWEDRAGRLELGLRHKTLGLEAGELSPEEQAKAAIRGIAREGRIVLAGRSGVRCGQTVELDKPGMGLFGRYLVSETRWVCDRGKETTEMGLVSV